MNNEKKTLFSNKTVKIGENSGYDNYIMAIETSCDETACAVVKNGREVLSNVVASQIKTHAKYGGVIPEIAAREHLEAINIVIEEAFEQAKIKSEEITAFAGTVGPGLVGSLLVGLNAAKTLALVWDKPFIGINHLNAHVCANYIDTDLKPPFIALLVSGGHTQIIEVKSHSEQKIIGETIDDAVGEAYDKVARLIGLPYPGGPLLDKMAKEGNPNAYKLPEAKVEGYDFSFSGLKTAVLRLVQSLKTASDELPVNDICASFQETVSETLLKKVKRALEETGYKQVVLAGGVAANSEIRRKFFELENQGYKVFAPQMKYCTDNAAMIASCAYFSTNTFDDVNVEVFSRV
ncbi:MAG TPA: tRNA (adenosine(37)-N6)-threonylcarbamoyltransferase complex transferase subunit TsaD [Candidatus Gastranaerophilaceae bacterium]|nr:tRNA (adenosine(37)-N6)-threonylcarbamoyltransferase complex transferase subunit TsaD [Candidatus Gastranaerophilaceae bacterium]HPT40923.1 tRNA (adenosine(37)-N6)-threonylcarbamoyltransferase complex transferase subunit TsaD [Candidatus Gastranaerophilaceae bacterium]